MGETCEDMRWGEKMRKKVVGVGNREMLKVGTWEMLHAGKLGKGGTAATLESGVERKSWQRWGSEQETRLGESNALSLSLADGKLKSWESGGTCER